MALAPANCVPALRRAPVAPALRAPCVRRLRAQRLENDEVGNMLPLNLESDEGLGGTSDERFGPDAVLLVGFLRDEAIRVRAMLDAIGAEFVRVVLLTPPLLEGTLGEALAAPPASAAAQPATGVPRVLFVSGMSGAEAVSVMDEFAELELPPAIFAAAVPKSVGKPMRDLLEEIQGDNDRLTSAAKA